MTIKKKKKAIVLSGGGAKGAYEAGVLKYIIEHWGLGIDIVVGTSAGALNAYLYSSLNPVLTNETNSNEIIKPWIDKDLENLLTFPIQDYIKFKFNSIFDNRKLYEFSKKFIDEEIKDYNLKKGIVSTLSLVTGEMQSGKTHVWYETYDDSVSMESNRWISHKTELNIDHAIASGAIPGVFRSVELETENGIKQWHNDGGVTMNTPISPAIQSGAEKILIIYLGNPDVEPTEDMPNIYEVFKNTIVTLFFYNHLKEDIIRAHTVNSLLDKLGKEEFSGYRKLDLTVIRPSQNIEEKIVKELKEKKFFWKIIPSFFLEIASLTALFMKVDYTEILAEFGYKDAKIMHKELESFFND